MGCYIDGVIGSEFAAEMAWLQNNCSKINVRINSGGGSVLDAFAIQAAIRNSKVPTDCYIDGIAASAAASIAVSGKKCYMADNAIFMIHNAIDTKGDSEKKVMDAFNDSIATTLSNRSKKTMGEVLNLMAKETWMNADECLAAGFVDEIISTEKKTTAPKIKNALELEAIYNEILTKPNNMKQINASLKLADNATESEVVNAISAKDAEIVNLKNENQILKDKFAAIENAAKDALKAKAVALAEKAFKDGKIEESEKASLIENASASEANFSLVEKMIGKVSNVKTAANIAANIDVTASNERSKWSWLDWSKNDPKGLEKMRNESPELFKQLYNQTFNKETK